MNKKKIGAGDTQKHKIPKTEVKVTDSTFIRISFIDLVKMFSLALHSYTRIHYLNKNPAPLTVM